MPIIHALEDLDPGLEIAQVIEADAAAAELPSHDQLYLDKAKEIQDSKKPEPSPEEAAASEDSGDSPVPDAENSETPTEEENSSDAPPEDGNDNDELEVIDGKQTTVATEALREKDYSITFALENYGEETLLQKTGALAWSGVKVLSGYAFHLAKELSFLLKDLGIEYGPKVYARLRSGVSYLLTKTFKQFGKLRSAVSRAYFQKTHSFNKLKDRLSRLKKTLEMIPDDFVLVQPAPFQDEALYGLFQVGNTVSPMKAIASISGLLDVVVNDIDRGIKNEISTLKRVVEVCRRNAKIEVLHYLRITGIGSSFLKKTVHGYEDNPDLLDSYLYTHALPRNTLVLAAIPKDSVVISAAKSNDMTEVTKAYNESYFILGVSQVQNKSNPLVNYMDKKSLLTLLAGLEAVVEKAISHVSFYKNLESEAASLKPEFQNYFSWLTEDEQAKTLRESLADVIYLKQAFITKVYLPGAIDIHDFVSTYVADMLGYVEKNIKVLKPKVEESEG